MDAVKQMRKEVKQYIDTADEKVVKMMHAMLEVQQEEDWWDDLPVEVQGEIDKSLAELDKGKGTSHAEVMKKHKKWFTR